MKAINKPLDMHYLTIVDLIKARDHFHVHLINKENVIATALGKYRIRNTDIDKNQNYKPSYHKNKSERTLSNSKVLDISWPCILVFVEKWITDDKIRKIDDVTQIIPNQVYMPDGKIIPICVVSASKKLLTDTSVNTSGLIFPKNLIGGGFPLIVNVQGEERIASIGCLVSDGNKIYAVTNKHVCGEEGTVIYSKLKGRLMRIGISSKKQIGKIKFEETYCDWKCSNILINADIGLIEIDDINFWKTEVFGIGKIGEMVDINSSNISLDFIGKKVFAYGAVSKFVSGEIAALFYRYKTIAGTEYVSDFLIGPTDGNEMKLHHGDSGTLWLLDYEKIESINGDEKNLKKIKEKLPIAIHWGQHKLLDDSKKYSQDFGLATALSNVCKILDVDVIRDWNLDQDYTWGKTGHFKIAARSCELVSDDLLSELLMLNQKNIGYTDDDLSDPDMVVKARSGDFVPLADVADLVWRDKRPVDASNHFADMDERNDTILNGKNLLELCENENFIDVDKWNDYYEKFEAIDEKKDKNKRGALPFRVWHMYNEMVKFLKQGDIEKFICAGGTMSHYVGDASQPLHISYLHHGRPGYGEEKVHETYETKMVDKFMSELFEGVNANNSKVKKSDLISGGGKEAAKFIIKLMRDTHKILPPIDIINAFNSSRDSRIDYEQMWNILKDKTIENLANGSLKMAIIWQSAWVEGKGENIPKNKIVEVDKQVLMDLYNDYEFVKSFKLSDSRFKNVLNSNV
jgi:hypothetical protein